MQPQIYIIEDEDSVRESLKALLDAVGWETGTYATAAGFLSDLSDEDGGRPQCRIVDIELPGLNGLDLLSKLNQRQEPIPAIVITGHGDGELESQATEQNAVDFFQKPFNATELLKVVSGVFAPVI